LANLALLLVAVVAVSGMYSASRGPGLRFAAADRDGDFDDAQAVRVDVLSEQDATVDGAPVATARLADEVGRRIGGRPGAPVVLVVSPEASYEATVTAYGAIAGLPERPRVAWPVLARGARE
jgi:hypothetical protein